MNRFKNLSPSLFLALVLVLSLAPGTYAGEPEAQATEEEAAEEKAALAIEPPTFPPGESWDSMPVMLKQLRELIVQDTGGGALAEAAERLWQVHHMSALVVLPTPDVKETEELFRMHVQELERSAAILDEAARRSELPAQDAARLLDVKLSLEAEIDSVQTIGLWTAGVRPRTPQARALHRRQIRAPFIPLPFPIAPPEEVVESDVIGVNECMVVVKEIQGLKVRLVAKVLPVWVEPWYARRRIVGHRIVWCLEFVPAQFIKRVVTCNDCCNKIRPQTFTEIIEHPELLHFWRYFKKGWYRHRY